MKPPAHTFGLSRRTTGLTPAHIELIKLLAKIAVENYLAETDSADTNEPMAHREDAP
jgi:hypothetical protein